MAADWRRGLATALRPVKPVASSSKTRITGWLGAKGLRERVRTSLGTAWANRLFDAPNGREPGQFAERWRGRDRVVLSQAASAVRAQTGSMAQRGHPGDGPLGQGLQPLHLMLVAPGVG